MRSFAAAGTIPAGQPILADDLLEFHAARILLLLHKVGVRNRIDGLTKMAKLDFFVRYPEFFAVARSHLKDDYGNWKGIVHESPMIRYHYGPWDTRYYQVLGFLEARGLLSVDQVGKMFRLTLPDQGIAVAKDLAKEAKFETLVAHMVEVKRLLGQRTGTGLKNLVYDLFDEEVAEKRMGERI